MKALRIVSIVAAAVALAFQVLPFGLVISSANIATYYSYFDFIAWGNGVIGPFFCGILTVCIIGMLIGSFFFKRDNRHYLLSIDIISWLALIFSLMPIIFDAYTVIGGIISALLLFCAEANMLIYKRITK